MEQRYQQEEQALLDLGYNMSMQDELRFCGCRIEVELTKDQRWIRPCQRHREILGVDEREELLSPIDFGHYILEYRGESDGH